jgi:thiosulfate/3-mercaptopyruvate sulfurtransferase
VVETDGLAAQLGTDGLTVIDLRPQPEYNSGHIPGALSLQVDSLRGNVGGVPSMLLPADLLAAHFSLLGLRAAQRVVLVSGDKLHDATLASAALLRVGHANQAVLNGGHAKWALEGRPVDATLPTVSPTEYHAKPGADTFTVGIDAVAAGLGQPNRVVLDVRPADYYAGTKSDEARAGHIPGAVNRPYTLDVAVGTNKVALLQPTEALAAAYAALIPSRDTEVIVHCRTGHQASQTFFVLTRLLDYTRVRWFDAGWTEWATRPELPVATGDR